jgi:membrane protein required for colicin V production
VGINLAAFDFILIGVVALSALVGSLRGFFREAMSLVVWICAVWVAVRFSSLLAPQLSEFIGNPQLRLWAARVLLVIGTLIAGGILTWLLTMALHGAGLGGTDRVIGMVFGLARGVLLAGLAIVVLRLAGFSDEPWWQRSKLIPYATPVTDALREAAEQGLGKSWSLSVSPAAVVTTSPSRLRS